MEKDGEGWQGTHIAEEKYFDLTSSYIMGKAANWTNITLKSKVNYKTKLLYTDYVEVATGWCLDMVLTMTYVVKIGFKKRFFENLFL